MNSQNSDKRDGIKHNSFKKISLEMLLSFQMFGQTARTDTKRKKACQSIP